MRPNLLLHQLRRKIFVAAFALIALAFETGLAQKTDFRELFDGSTLDGWKHKGNWRIEDGTLTRSGKGGGITYDAMTVPDDFELQFEWKVANGSNSGVYYRPGQYEYQILDNDVHRDGKNPRTSAASLYFCMQPSHDATQPIGKWNTARVICKGSVVQHWLNGQKVIHFDYEAPEFAFNVEMLKQRGGELAARGGKLMLQDHGDPVWYRSIRIREIAENEAIDMSPVTPAQIDDETLAAEKQKLDGIVARRKKQQAKKAKAEKEKGVKALETIN